MQEPVQSEPAFIRASTWCKKVQDRRDASAHSLLVREVTQTRATGDKASQISCPTLSSTNSTTTTMSRPQDDRNQEATVYLVCSAVHSISDN